MTQRVLVVEDDALLALDMADQLRDAGLEVIGPATTVAKALTLLDEQGCDVAVLDVHLGAETSTPVAQALGARGIPFVIVSGYSTDQLPPEFANVCAISKPARPEDLIARLSQLKRG